MKITTQNHLPTYKERSGGEVFKTIISGGAGDASLSPPQEHRHTPALSLGAVRVPAFAPKGGGDFTASNSPLRILLSEAVTKHLEDHGVDCFIVIAKDKSDQHSGRMVIHLMPCTMRTARDAEAVINGKARAVFPKTPKPSPAAPLTAAEIRMA